MPTMRESRSGDAVDIAIVGAGIAGLYAAWRLLQSGINAGRIRIFEASDRIGGRILTRHPPGSPSLALELGACNIRDDHVLTLGLARHFQLASAETSEPQDCGLICLRGRCRTRHEVKRSIFRRPFAYDVSGKLQRRGPARLMRNARRRIAAERNRARGKRDLDQWPLNAALLQVLGIEEIRYLTDRTGYSFWQAPLNTVATLNWAERNLFRASHNFTRLADGAAGLTRSLADALARSGIEIEFDRRLDAIDFSGAFDGPVSLRLQGSDGARQTIAASQVILAMPRRAIELISGLAEQQPVQALLASVVGWPVFTSATVYREAWWRPSGLVGETTITDLPAGHIQQHTAHRAGGAAAALVSHADGANTAFWRPLLASNLQGAWLDAGHAAPVELHRQIKIVFEEKLRLPVPEPSMGICQDWSQDPYGGGFHLWAFGSRPEAAAEAALQPLPGRPVHICGEAWSSRQGWIEGALETVEQLLRRHFAA